MDDYSSELLEKVNVEEMEDDKDGNHMKKKVFFKGKLRSRLSNNESGNNLRYN